MTTLKIWQNLSPKVMNSRKVADAEGLVAKAANDKKVQKLIGKKAPPGKRGRPSAKAKAKGKAAPTEGEKQPDNQPKEGDKEPELEPEKPDVELTPNNGEGETNGDSTSNADGGKIPGDGEIREVKKPDATDLLKQWALVDSWLILCHAV